MKEKMKYSYLSKVAKNGKIPLEKTLTLIKTKDSSQSGILGYYTIEEAIAFINNMEKPTKKLEQGFLRGIFEGGTRSEHHTKGSRVLFIDIDVKTQDIAYKKHLAMCDKNPAVRRKTKAQCQAINAVIHPESSTYNFGKLAQLKKWLTDNSIFWSYSDSGTGMMAAFLVDGLDKFTNKDNSRYKRASESIYRLLEADIKTQTGLTLELDDSQGAFRQVRFVSYQKGNPVVINHNHLQLEVTENAEVVKTSTGHTVYTFEKGERPETGSVSDAYNDVCDRMVVAESLGFYYTSGNDLNHDLSSNDKAANFTDSPRGIKVWSETVINDLKSKGHSRGDFLTLFDAHRLGMGLTYGQMCDYVKKTTPLKEQLININKMASQVTPDLTNPEIYKLVFPLIGKSIQQRQEFFDKANIPTAQEDVYRGFLDFKDLAIKFDSEVHIKEWLAEELGTMFDLADKHGKICICANTNSGKTYSFSAFTKVFRPDSRVLVVVPLTTIGNQVDRFDSNGNEFDLEVLIGTRPPEATFWKAKSAQVVFATHAHAVSILAMCDFDYIVFDEMHSNILGLDYRRDTIAKTFYSAASGDMKVIALTGTPTKSLKKLDYHMIKVHNAKDVPLKVMQRIDNRETTKLVLQYIQYDVKKGEKAFFRINSMEAINKVKNEVIKLGLYKEDEILIMSSEHKTTPAFRQLEYQGTIQKGIKLVLTTSVIDEGVNIKNTDYAHYVFVSRGYHPIPQPAKQSTARFRNAPESMRFTFYRQLKKEDWSYDYEETFDTRTDQLKEGSQQLDEYGTVLSENKFRYADGETNPLAVAFEDDKNFFDSLNNEDFIAYMAINYSLNLAPDEDYENEKVEIPKGNSKERKELIDNIIKNEWGRMLASIFHNSKDQKTKDFITESPALWSAMDTSNPTKAFDDICQELQNRFLPYMHFVNKLYSVDIIGYPYLFDMHGEPEGAVYIAKKGDVIKLQVQYEGFGVLKGRELSKKLSNLVTSINENTGNISDIDFRKAVVKAKISIGREFRANRTQLGLFLTINSNYVYDEKNQILKPKQTNDVAVSLYYKQWMQELRGKFVKMKNVAIDKPVNNQTVIDFSKEFNTRA